MHRDLVIALGLGLVALWQNLAALDLTPFHPDETRWLNRAHYVRDVTDPFGPTWRDGYLTRGQPPLGSYLMGVGLLVQGRDLETNGVWNFHHGAGWNEARGNMASRADLAAGRRTNALVGALTVAVVYLAGARLTNRVGGLVGALVLAVHPLMIALASQAMADALLVLLLALAVLAAGRLAERPSWSGALLLGTLLGLGGATKLSPLLLTLPLAGLGAALLARAWWVRRTRGAPSRPGEPLGWKLVALPAIAAVVFVAVYPYLWPDPLARTVNLFSFRLEEMARQGGNWEDVAVGDRTEALRRVGIQLGDRFMASGRLAATLGDRVGLRWQPPGLDLPLALIGAQALVAMAVIGGARGRHALPGLILGGQTGLIVLGLRSDFARYHLPVLLAMAFTIGVATGIGWSSLVRIARQIDIRARGIDGWGRLQSSSRRPASRLKVAGLLAGLVISTYAGTAIRSSGALTTTVGTAVASPVLAATPWAEPPVQGTPQPGEGTPAASPAGTPPVATPVEAGAVGRGAGLNAEVKSPRGHPR